MAGLEAAEALPAVRAHHDDLVHVLEPHLRLQASLVRRTEWSHPRHHRRPPYRELNETACLILVILSNKLVIRRQTTSLTWDHGIRSSRTCRCLGTNWERTRRTTTEIPRNG